MMFRVLIALLVMSGPALADPAPGSAAAVDAFRKGVGMAMLRHDPRLQATAEAHADDMARQGYFSHKGKDGSTPGKRAKRAGYRWCWIAENIAQGQKSVDEVMRAWAGSPGHRKNMTHPKAREYGLARGPGNTWVMVLARPRPCR